FPSLAHIAAHGVAVVRACQNRIANDVIELGYSPSPAKAWKRTAEAFLGPADSPKVQREAVAAAEQAGLSIDRLTMINRHPGAGVCSAGVVCVIAAQAGASIQTRT